MCAVLFVAAALVVEPLFCSSLVVVLSNCLAGSLYSYTVVIVSTF